MDCLQFLGFTVYFLGLGARDSGSVIRDSVPLILPAKHLVDHVD